MSIRKRGQAKNPLRRQRGLVGRRTIRSHDSLPAIGHLKKFELWQERQKGISSELKTAAVSETCGRVREHRRVAWI